MMTPEFDARRAFRARDGRLLVTLGGTLAIVALLLSALTTHSITRQERAVAGLEARMDSLRTASGATPADSALVARIASTGEGLASARSHLDVAEAQRDDLWTLTGASTLLAALGGLLVGAGFATLRRARIAQRPPLE